MGVEIIDNKIKKQVSIALSGLLCGSSLVTDVFAYKLDSTIEDEDMTANFLENRNVTNKGIVTATSLNVRKEPSTNALIVGFVQKGQTVEILNKESSGWYKIKYGNGYGYVSELYINISSNSNSNTSQATTVTHTGVVNANSLNVRREGKVSSSKIGALSRGTKVNIVDKLSNGWYKIKFNNGYGYISGDYISNVASSNSSNETQVINTGTTNTDTLNVRSGPSTTYEKIGYLSRGTTVEVVNIESNGWYKIKYKDGYGYVSSSYINIAGERNNLNNFLFIGDSFTVGIQNIINSKNSNAYVYAKSGSRPSYWLDKVDSMPNSSKINGVCLLIGVNGASTSVNKSDVKTLINKLSAKYPDKTIYVQKVFPVGREFTGANPASFNKSIASLNSVIEYHCETKSNVKFIDTTTGFVDSNGYLIHDNGDGLHISGSYSKTFYNNILSAIKIAEKGK